MLQVDSRLLGGVFMLAAVAAPADALVLVNQQTTLETLLVTEENAQTQITIRPGERLEGVCPKGCVIRLGNGEEYEFDGSEVVSLEDDALFLEEVPEESAAGK